MGLINEINWYDQVLSNDAKYNSPHLFNHISKTFITYTNK